MIFNRLVRCILIGGLTIAISACDSSSPAVPAIEFSAPAGAGSIATPDAVFNLSGSATSDHSISEVTWRNDQGSSGIAAGAEEWQIFNIPLSEGTNQVTVTASDTAGNSNSRSISIVRETTAGAATGSTIGAGDGGLKETLLMYSYDPEHRHAAPADGAAIEPGPVYFYVIPSDDWNKNGIDHMAYYCCTKSGQSSETAADEPPRLAVSREPWSMYIDLTDFQPGEQRTIDVEATLVDGNVVEGPEIGFVLASDKGEPNTPPAISGTPTLEVPAGKPFEFLPDAKDADGDTLSFSIVNQPSWTEFNPITGRLSGAPSSADVGRFLNVVISVSDGKTSTSMPAFTITVVPGDPESSPEPPPQTTPPPPPPPPSANSESSPPEIARFSSSASSIARGVSATLSWSVNNATSVSISPQPGTVEGSSTTVSPQSTTTYTLTAQNSVGKSTASVTVQVRSDSSSWTVSERPPTMSNPKLIDVSKLGTSTVPEMAGGLLCAGKVYKVNVSAGEDAIVYMSANTPLKYPVHVTGGRNVRVVGLQFELVTQPGCGVGELPNAPTSQHVNANIHPRIPGAIAIRMQQSGMSFLEGLHIDVKGHEADCIVSRNPNSMTDSQARSQRDFVVQNTYCSGVEGLGKSPIGDGVHGDLFQNQGQDILRRLVFENVSMRTSQEGIVLHGNGSTKGATSLTIRRYDYTWDPRYVGDDSYEQFGLAFDGRAEPGWTFEDIRIDDYRDGVDYLKINGDRYGSFSNSVVTKHPEIRSGLPPEGAFALPGRTGINYVSPHGQVPTN